MSTPSFPDDPVVPAGTSSPQQHGSEFPNDPVVSGSGSQGNLTDYQNMPWSQVAERGATNFLPSMWSAAKAIPTAIAHPQETAGAIGQVGTGLYSKAQGLFENQDPSAKAHNEAVLNSLIEPYTSWAGFKKALAEDPFSVLTTASIPLSMGAGALAKGADFLGQANLAGKAAGALSKTAGAASTAMDPIKLAQLLLRLFQKCLERRLREAAISRRESRRRH